MDAISKALHDIKHRIPRAILEAVFIPYNGLGRSLVSNTVDYGIVSNVIRGRVMHDCNMVGGTQAIIPLEGLEMEKPSNWETVFRVPKNRTDNKVINSVLNVTFMSPASATNLAGVLPNYNTANSTGALMQSYQALLSSFDSIPNLSTARAQLIGENVVLIRDNIILSSTSFLRCVLSNDENLSNINLRSHKHFSMLCTYAVKAYIYNELVINLDQGRLQGGYEIGAFKSMVDGYSDAEDNYNDYLRDTWEAVAFMNDDMTYNRFITAMIGAGK